MMRREMSSKDTSINKLKKSIKKLQQPVEDQKKRKQALYDAKEWYTIRALLGNQ